MLVVLPPALTNILLATATQCCFDFQSWGMKRDAKHREHHYVLATVAKKGKPITK
jgi:hypothetical protein